MKFSVSSYSFSQYVRSGKLTQAGCVSAAHDLGFDAIEFTDIEGDTFEKRVENANAIRDLSDKYNLPVCAYAVGASLYQDTDEGSQKQVEALCRHLDIAKILGAPVMRHDICYKLGKTGSSRSFDLMLPTIVKNVRAVADYAQSLGIRTCTENHGFISQDSDRIERLFNAVAHDNFGILVDVGNFLCVDENPITAVSRVAPYAIHVHAKDFIPTPGRGIKTRGANYISGAVIGDGIVPVKQCLDILKSVGYDSYITLEYEADADCIEGIKTGLARLRDYVK